VPALLVSPPVKVLTPLNTSSPKPVLVKPADPEIGEAMMPMVVTETEPVPVKFSAPLARVFAPFRKLKPPAVWVPVSVMVLMPVAAVAEKMAVAPADQMDPAGPARLVAQFGAAVSQVPEAGEASQ